MADLVPCETVSAICIHLRELPEGEKLQLSGFRKRPKTVCGMDAAWNLPGDAARVTCGKCRPPAGKQ